MIACTSSNATCKLGFTNLIQDIINDEIPDSPKRALRMVLKVAIAKKDGGFRPIAMMEEFTKLAALYLLSIKSDTIGNLFNTIDHNPLQAGVGTANGCEVIFHKIRDSLTANPNLTVLKVDAVNAFGRLKRKALVDALACHQELRDFYKLAKFCFESPSEYTFAYQGRLCLDYTQQEGVFQGDPLSPLYFALTLQRLLIEVVDAVPGVHVSSYLDDVYILGTPDQCFATLRVLQEQGISIGYVINRAKCVMLTMPDSSSSELDSAAAMEHVTVSDSVKILGTPYARSASEWKVLITEKGKDIVEKLKLLQNSVFRPQLAYTLMRYSFGIPAFQYMLRLCPPGICGEVKGMYEDVAAAILMNKFKCDTRSIGQVASTRLQLPERYSGVSLFDFSLINRSAFVGSIAAVCKYLSPSSVMVEEACNIYSSFKSSFPEKWKIVGAENSPASFFGVFSSNGVLSSHLQKALCEAVWKQSYELLLKDPEPWVRAIVGSNGKGSGRFLQANRTAFGGVFHIQDEAFVASFMYRMGLPILPNYKFGDRCKLCDLVLNPSEPCGYHFLNCLHLTGGVIKNRHDSVRDALVALMRVADAVVVKEPMLLSGQSEEDGSPTCIGYGDIGYKNMSTKLIERDLVVDINVNNPLANSNIAAAARTVGGAAESAEGRKDYRYKHLNDSLKRKVVPFVVETTGLLGKRALALTFEIVNDIRVTQLMSEHDSLVLRRSFLDDIAILLANHLWRIVAHGTLLVAHRLAAAVRNDHCSNPSSPLVRAFTVHNSD